MTNASEFNKAWFVYSLLHPGIPIIIRKNWRRADRGRQPATSYGSCCYSGGTPLCRPARANDKVTNPAHPPSFTHHPTLPRLTATTVTSESTSAGARRLRVGVRLVPWLRGACRAGAAPRLRLLLPCSAAASAAAFLTATAASSPSLPHRAPGTQRERTAGVLVEWGGGLAELGFVS